MKAAVSWILIVFATVSCATQQGAHRDPRESLAQGREVMQGGDPQRAITEYFDPVINQFQAKYKGTGKHVYCASNMTEGIIYSALPSGDNAPVEVIDSTWAEAYLMKGYALVELNRLDDARQSLNAAIALSPMNPQYISELAYTYQAQHDCDKSIETYAHAESVVELGSDEKTKTAAYTRAWRGQGYCLVEQKKFDEAEAMYRKCLALDPTDDKARGELEYLNRARLQ